MRDQKKHQSTDGNNRDKRFISRFVSRDNAAMLLGLVAVILWGVSAFHDHAWGEDWPSAIGLIPDRDLLQILGDFVVPVMLTVFMLQAVRKLPPSREKTVLTWLGWSLFVFLFVWWSPLRITIFGTF